MPEHIDRRVSPRTPWLLPIVLALLVLAIVLAVLLGSRIKSALNSPTSTPVVRTVVVTSTPVAGTAAPAGNPAVLPSATSGSGSGVVRPLPGATPVSTVPDLQLGEITRPQHVVTAIQTAASRGSAPYAFYLDPRKVVQYDLPAYGFSKGFEIVSPAPSPAPTPQKSSDGRFLVKFLIDYQGHVYTVFVVQPGKQGHGGIWLIVTILPGRQ